MAEEPQEPGAERPAGGETPVRDVGGDLIIPVLSAAFTIYYFSTIWELTWEAQINGLMIGSVLLALIAVFAVRTTLAVRRGRARLAWGDVLWPREVLLKRALLLLLSIAFIGTIQWLGFTLATGLFLASALYVLGVRGRARLIGLPLALSLGGYLLFIVALGTRFPHGIVERLLGGLF